MSIWVSCLILSIFMDWDLVSMMKFTYLPVTLQDFSILLHIESLKRAFAGFSISCILSQSQTVVDVKLIFQSLQKALMYKNKFEVMLYDQWKVQTLFQEEKAEKWLQPQTTVSVSCSVCK